VLECLADERNRGRKTIDEIAHWMVDNSGVNPPEDDGYGPRAGLCLEPQNFPDAPSLPNFPKSGLDPGEMYTNRVVYKFAAS
jgi:galactose mutarotase-like enzyme